MTVKEWRATLLKLASSSRRLGQPVNFTDMEEQGIITKDGAWYIVHKPLALPLRASEKVYEMRWDPKTRVVWMKFRKPSKNAEQLAERFEKQIEELDAQQLNPDDQIQFKR